MASQIGNSVGLARRVSPKPSRPERKPPSRKPPARPNPRPKPPAKKPGRRKEPRPRPVPVKPNTKPRSVPFGEPNPNPVKRPPKEYGKVAGKTFKRVVKALPWISAATTVGTLAYIWYNQEKTDLSAQGWTKCCDIGGPKNAYRFSQITRSSTSVICQSGNHCGLGGQVPHGAWGLAGNQVPGGTTPRSSFGSIQTLYLGPLTTGGARMTFAEKWQRFLPGNTVYPPIPAVSDVPVFIPGTLPQLDPGVETIPVAPPLNRPNYDPTPKNPPMEYPRGRPSERPSIDFDPVTGPKTGSHEQRPPDKTEREKKKRLSNALAGAWASFLGKAVNGYTETDDFIAALYKGLHWKVRRWRGSDGVWRDRDITSIARTNRIYSEMGNFDVTEAIKAVAANEAVDQAFGRVGKALAGRARSLGDQGLWAGTGGFQRGTNLRQKEWDNLQKKLKKQQAEKVGVRQYTRNVYDLATNSWRKETVAVTDKKTIPWYRQTSTIPRTNRAGKTYTKPYYAARSSPAPILGYRKQVEL